MPAANAVVPNTALTEPPLSPAALIYLARSFGNARRRSRRRCG